MRNFGFVRVAAAVPFGRVGDIEYNKNQIISMIKDAAKNSASIIVFPELAIPSYTCQDLFQHSTIIDKSKDALIEIAKSTKNLPILSVIGLPVLNNNQLFNSAALVNKGKVLGIIPKLYLPGYREFYEPRWFSDRKSEYFDEIELDGSMVPFGENLLFRDKSFKELVVGVEICKDLWVPVPPSSYQALNGATVICNLSASDIVVSKSEYRRKLVGLQSSRCFSGYIYASSGTGESTTDLVFDGDAMIYENGVSLSETERFKRKNQIIYGDIDIEKLTAERLRENTFCGSEKEFRFIEFESVDAPFDVKSKVSMQPFVPSNEKTLGLRCSEIFNIQAAGLAKRMESIPGVNAVIGISGGLDSTLALLATIKTFKLLGRDLKSIHAVTMPGFGTTDRTYNNAVELCKDFGVTFHDISVKEISTLMLNEVKHDIKDHNVVYENVQARSRTFLLMTLANKYNGIVIGTGDLSEIALGWSTYNGDHISMYNVNASVPKTLVKFLVKWAANNEFNGKVREILFDILEQPISPELIPPDGDNISQKTEDKIGPYILHDFFLYYFVRFGFKPKKLLFLAEIAFKGKYSQKEIAKWLKVFLKRFFENQWKRDCVPAGPKVGSVDLSPRGSWRMPSEADFDTFFSDF